MSQTAHVPVLLKEVVEHLAPRPTDIVLDGTVGEGGHAVALLDRMGHDGRLLGLDRDPQTLAIARERLARYGDRVVLEQASFAEAGAVLERHATFQPITRVLLDLGMSSRTIDASGRGFSFQQSEEPLDMRFDPAAAVPTAADLLATLPEREIATLIANNGEEPLARSIAREIILRRQTEPLRRVADLVHAVHAAYRRRQYRRPPRMHPATRTFQALRIAVNDELATLQLGLARLLDLLAPGGRIAVISFHSLEDRIVKETFRSEARGCICPPEIPVCRCGHEPRLRLLTRHVLTPTPTEQTRNPRSRSAKLRVAEKISS